MISRGKLNDYNELFLPPDKRPQGCTYFYRINGFSQGIDALIKSFMEEARRCGSVIEGGIPNPTQENLAYYNEIMGGAFRNDTGFISGALSRWLPRIPQNRNRLYAEAIKSALSALEAEGKNENIIKNAYIKFMCWLYYKFEYVVQKTDGKTYPKILYEGDITRYELVLLSVLCSCGCDILLLQYKGDGGYLKLDPASKYSDELTVNGAVPFPEGYSIARLREEQKKKAQIERLYGGETMIRGTNAWANNKPFEDASSPAAVRGSDPNVIYNCFYLVNGTQDKVYYPTQLFDLKKSITDSGRGLCVTNGSIPPPDNDEIKNIRRSAFTSFEQMIAGLVKNLDYIPDKKLRSVITKAFADTMTAAAEEGAGKNTNLSRLCTKGVYILCWLKRCFNELYKGFKNGFVGCYIFFSGSCTENEAYFLRFLAATPTDVLILSPNLNNTVNIDDSKLLIINYAESVDMTEFPSETSGARVGTVAYHAERELDTILYSDSGLYRDRQYSKAQTLILQTMCEEIPILWDQELKYRPSFSADGGQVCIPAIFAKVSGVKDGKTDDYWRMIKKLITPETYLIKQAPFIPENEPNDLKQYTAGFFRGNRLRRDVIMSHKAYRYGFLKESTQEHILDKIQLLLDGKMIRDADKFGRQYLILATALDLNKELLRMIQSFDFTKKNPKIIYINTTETEISLEDTIVMRLLSLIGFDVVFFVPTGYRCIEKYFADVPFTEHEAGNYVYDLTVPDFSTIQLQTRLTWVERLFGKKQ